MLKHLFRLTSLARVIDLRVPSNRVVALASVLALAAGVGYSVTQGEPVAQAVALGIEYALSVFLAWAIARELDPDKPRSAFFSILLAALLLVTEGRPFLPGVLQVLLIARILVRSTGSPPTLLDLGVLVALAAFGARAHEGIPTGLILGGAVILDARLHDPAPRRSLIGGSLIIVSTLLAGWYFSSFEGSWTTPTTAQWILLAIISAACACLDVPSPTSADDRKRSILSRTRLSAGTWTAVAAGASSLLWVGGPAFASLGPLFAALVGVAFSRSLPKPQPDTAREID